MPTVVIADARVHYERFGSSTGVPLVLVHGTGSSGAGLTWGDLAPRFAERRPVVTVDLSGSDRTEDGGGPLTVEGLAEQVAAVVGAVTDQPVDLLGFSMGAPVTAAVAALRPGLVRRLALVAGWAYTEGDEYLRNLFALWRRLGPLDASAFGRSVTLTGFSRGFLNVIGRERVEQLIPAMPPTPGTLRHVELDTRIDIRELLPRITARTLVVSAAQDATVPVAHSRSLHAAIASSGYAQLEAGHVMFVEQPQVFLEIVSAFLDAV